MVLSVLGFNRVSLRVSVVREVYRALYILDSYSYLNLCLFPHYLLSWRADYSWCVWLVDVRELYKVRYFLCCLRESIRETSMSRVGVVASRIKLKPTVRRVQDGYVPVRAGSSVCGNDSRVPVYLAAIRRVERMRRVNRG